MAEECLQFLIGLVRDEKARAKDRADAARYVLERRFGRVNADAEMREDLERIKATLRSKNGGH